MIQSLKPLAEVVRDTFDHILWCKQKCILLYLRQGHNKKYIINAGHVDCDCFGENKLRTVRKIEKEDSGERRCPICIYDFIFSL